MTILWFEWSPMGAFGFVIHGKGATTPLRSSTVKVPTSSGPRIRIASCGVGMPQWTYKNWPIKED